MVDNTAPTLSIGGLGASISGPVTATFSFSEAVTGFAADDISVGNGTASAFSGSGAAYTALITPTTNGTAVTVNVAANAAQDAVGNNSQAAAQVSASFTRTLQAPGSFTATGGDGQVSLSWSAPADSGGTARLPIANINTAIGPGRVVGAPGPTCPIPIVIPAWRTRPP